MSALIHDGLLVADPYRMVADDESLSDGEDAIVSLARWTKECPNPDQPGMPQLGVHIPNTLDVGSLAAGILRAPVIVLEFPSFGDGRGYSQARQLRDALGYRGDLRATGAAVVRDQLLGMLRCGINSFLLRAGQVPEECLAALKEFSLAYQPAIDPVPQVRQLRLVR